MQKKNLNRNLIFLIIFLFVASCSSVPKYPTNACEIFGERYFVYKGDWGNSRTTYRWWIDQPRFAFEPSSKNPIHCEDTREACFRQIQEWEDLKVKKAQSHVEEGWRSDVEGYFCDGD